MNGKSIFHENIRNIIISRTLPRVEYCTKIKKKREKKTQSNVKSYNEVIKSL